MVFDFNSQHGGNNRTTVEIHRTQGLQQASGPLGLNKTEPYVLVHANGVTHRTSTKCGDPAEYNETFEFTGNVDYIKFEVYDKHSLTADTKLGEADFNASLQPQKYFGTVSLRGHNSQITGTLTFTLTKPGNSDNANHNNNNYNPGGNMGGNYNPGGNHNSGMGGNYNPGDSHNSGMGGNYNPGGNHNSGMGGNYNPGGSHNSGMGGNYNPGGSHNSGMGGNYNPGGSHNSGMGGNYNPGMGGNYNPGGNHGGHGSHGGNYNPGGSYGNQGGYHDPSKPHFG